MMIPESEISECVEYTVKSKMGKIFANEKILVLKLFKLILIFMRNTKKQKLMKMGMTTYYLELMFIFLNIISCRSNEKGHTDRDLLF